MPDFYANAWLTIGEILIAYALAAVFGVLIGIAVASSKVIGDAFEPILLVLYAVPKIILYPVIVLMIGTGPGDEDRFRRLRRDFRHHLQYGGWAAAGRAQLPAPRAFARLWRRQDLL